MSEYTVSKVYPNEAAANRRIDELLRAQGIRRDGNLDYTCAIYDEDYEIIATGSCYANTLRCLAVSSSHQGEGLMNTIVTHLMEIQYARGNSHIFLYTKCSSAKFFQDLGFHKIACVENQLIFMENRSTGFSSYLDSLTRPDHPAGTCAGMVINANPFTLGHQYLVERAAAENDVLHLFIVSEDVSLIPYSVRKQLIMAGTAHLSNIYFHDCGPYMISNATFPSYFQKDEQDIITGHARLDLAIFSKIAGVLSITRRYVGEEPYSQVTGIYNQIMKTELPKAGISCIVIPRKESKGVPISASTVRKAIKDDRLDLLTALVPQTTLDFFKSEEARDIIRKIRLADNVIHY